MRSSSPVIFAFLGMIALSVSCKIFQESVNGGDSDVKSVYEHHGLDAYGPIPANLDKEITCPGVENSTAAGTFNGKSYTYKSSDEIHYGEKGWEDRVAGNWDALSDLGLPSGMDALVIDIRRVGGKPYYLYLANGKSRIQKTQEPWSSSKFMAAVSAGARARLDSKGEVGLSGSIGAYNIGDMITSIHTYAPTRNVNENSNGIAWYFLNVAGRNFATLLLHDRWLKLSDASSFNGKYGKSLFSTGTDTWTAADGVKFTVADKNEAYTEKSLSLLSLGEFLKRLTQHEADKSTALDLLTQSDVKALFYGNLTKSGEMGGMLAGASVYMAQGLMGGAKVGQPGKHGGAGSAAAKALFDEKTGGKWRIFHKLGAGQSDTRGREEIVMATYACLPQFQGGREFVVITSAPAGTLGASNTNTEKAFNAIVPKLVPGFSR
jgi:hypothetical protein